MKVADRSRVAVEELDVPIPVRPAWRRTPTRTQRATKKSTKKLREAIDGYCAEQYDRNQNKTICDLAGAAGFDSVTQMINHARRNGGKTMRYISRGLLSVAADYEDQAQAGNRHAIRLLEIIPHFDSTEPADQTPQLPLQSKPAIDLNITGIESRQNRGAHLSEQEAYLQLIKHKTYEEIAPHVLETEKTVEGDYQVLEFDTEDEKL